MNSHINNLLAALQSYAPSGSAQVKAAELVWNGERHGATEDEIICSLANAISDGLMRGNWPWPNENVSQSDSAPYSEWMEFRRALDGFSVQGALDNLKEWYEQRPHTHVTEEFPSGGSLTSGREECMTCKQVESYIRRLARQGYIDKTVHLLDVLVWDWNIKILKEK